MEEIAEACCTAGANYNYFKTLRTAEAGLGYPVFLVYRGQGASGSDSASEEIQLEQTYEK